MEVFEPKKRGSRATCHELQEEGFFLQCEDADSLPEPLNVSAGGGVSAAILSVGLEVFEIDIC